MRLDQKAAIVTGAGSGLGRAIALRMMAEGATVVLTGRRVEPLRETLAQALAGGGRGEVMAMDMTDAAAVEHLVQHTVRQHGGLDILVNNAGANGPRGTCEATGVSNLDQLWAVNVRSLFVASLAALPALRARKGSILNIASGAAMRGVPGMAAYGATKAAVVSLTKSMALELAAAGVRVNAVCPGRIPSEINTEWFAQLRARGEFDAIVAQIPLGRLGSPDDVAHAAVYLCSDEAAWVSGVALGVDGGTSATW